MLLLGLGLIILSSASTVVSFSKFKTSSYYLLSQLKQGVLVGLILMYLCSKINYHFWQKYAALIMLAAMALLVAVLALHGHTLQVGNARRWLVLGPIVVQPAEIAKLAMIIYIASWIDKRRHEVKDSFYGIVPALLMIGLMAGLIVLQPDIGTTIVLIGTAYIMLFIGGSKLKHLGWILAGMLVSFAVLVKLEPYRIERFLTFLHRDADPQGIGYQINQALVAIGSGGFWGQGYGNSRQKYNFLPEVMGDSIFAVTVEELGFLRASVIVVLFLWLALRGLKIARSAPDLFGKMLASGIVVWISLQALVNIGAIIGILPLTGVPLPFISYGSSSLIITLAAMGIMLNISKHRTA